ncbi:penicillin-binding protein [Streptomyces sp. NA04227]|uniref:transglycosylase domain-containing protein n=1 Tax=Streptomyces sp. NA04227 TaxID=2742136 RepID=UPI0015926CE7|nr:transglycosylase domain-containing protein [Streptomyces sp. NA04227]QKW08891.1 penicillin-binding protein [Streptomyces sp. NA04227]
MAQAGSGRAGRSGIRRFLSWKKVLGTFFVLCLMVMGAFVVLYMVVDIPEGNAAAKAQSNVYKYSNGKTFARTGDVNRELVELSEVPIDVQHSFVAAENKSFYKDQGVDLKGTTRGLFNTLSGNGKQGGSTITQQYVKNYYLTQERTVSRKLKELVISLKVDRKMSKDEILAGYLNTSYYGRGAYGIQAAAQAYYGVDARDLNVAQGAYLAALLQAPSAYDWHAATDNGKARVKARWNYVLNNMVEEDWLDKGKRSGLTFPVPKDPKGAPGLEGQRGYLVKAANAQLVSQLQSQGVSREDAVALVDAGGWNITLNVDEKKQQQLEKSVKKRLTSQLSPKTRAVDGDVQAGAVSVDPKTGKVLAMYGGEDYLKHYTNNATRIDYQPASTFKPVILAAALAAGAVTQDDEPITADTVYDGTSKRPVQGSDIPFAPENEDDESYGPVSVQRAMNKSVNSVFAQMGVDVGMDEVMEMAETLGMQTEGQEAVPAQTLGTMGASPLDMAGVYATFANHGEKVSPAMIKEADHMDHQVDFPDPIGEQVLDREVADSLTSVLQGVVDDGTGYAVRNPLQEVAGKTGTSDDNKSAWFTGYTPDLVTSVGLFGEAGKSRTDDSGKKIQKGAQVTLSGAAGGGRVNGGGFPAQIWAAYTFDAMGEPTPFDLETDMGAGIDTPPTEESPLPEETPDDQVPPTQEPEEPPTTEEPPPTDEPPTDFPTDPPTTDEPTDPPTIEPPPTADPTWGIPEDPDGRRARRG